MGLSRLRRQALPRSARIQRAGEYDAVRRAGVRLVKGCLITNWLGLAPDTNSRLGVVTSRRIGGAVVRNRARRLLREVFRRNRHCLERPVDVVLVARQSIARMTYARVERDYLDLARRAARLLKT